MQKAIYSWILRNSLLVVLLVVATVAAMTSGARLLTFSSDYRMFFSSANPQLQAFEALQNTYSKSDNILFVISPEDANVFSQKTLDAVEWLTKEAWQTPYSARVDSITNFQFTEAQGDDLSVHDLVVDALGLSQADLDKARTAALSEPMLVNRILSADAAHTAVNITLQLLGKKLTEASEAAIFARELAAKLRARNPELGVRLSGLSILNNAFPEATQHDMKTLYPGMFLVILVVLAFMLRSIPVTLVTGLILLMTIFGTMGLTGWLGIKMSPPTSSVAVIVMTLAVADCVHLSASFLHYMRHGMAKREAMLEAMLVNGQAVFLTSLTTAVGFLTLNSSEAPPFRDLGNMAAMGVTLAWFLAVVFLPALLMLLPVRHTGKATVGHAAMEHLANWIIHNRKLLLWVNLALALLLVPGLFRNELNDDFIKYFSEKVEFRRDTDFMLSHLTGVMTNEYSLPADGEWDIAEPAYLNKIEDFANWYRQQPKVKHVNVFTDVMKRLNKSLHGDDPAWYKIPDNRELAAQYLLLYEMSLPFGLDLTNQVNSGKSATRMTVTFGDVTGEELLDTERKAQAWLAENAPKMATPGASPAVMFANIGHRNIRAMLKGSVIATLVISIILILALKSWKLGLLSLLPNILPVAVAFGVWGYTVGQIGLALSVVASVTIGIVVDDTIHFLSKYQRARKVSGLSPEDAVRYSFGTVGTALWVTTLVLVLGFSVLILSDFKMNAGMGLLTAITIAIALLADFFLLPTLLLKMEGKNHE